ncbi:hypothetical protein [Cytobacillus oceanisediminis]|uniref:hypothetical protein n=1 Tax=Cytobacillus oceanisediminis TaxID=665099 RepID=UPI0024949D55|nr:hypothetical protein [Cytobacillus oceanisediminis]
MNDESEIGHLPDRGRVIGERVKVSPHSDRKSGNPEVRVRNRSLFGQEKRKFGSTSPKLVTIRTEEAEVWRYKSEVGTHSDRRRGNPEVRVRSQSPFGQKKG